MRKHEPMKTAELKEKTLCIYRKMQFIFNDNPDVKPSNTNSPIQTVDNALMKVIVGDRHGVLERLQ